MDYWRRNGHQWSDCSKRLLIKYYIIVIHNCLQLSQPFNATIWLLRISFFAVKDFHYNDELSK